MVRTQEKDIEILNVRFPSEIIAIVDGLIEQGLYKSRSEAIRDMLRSSVLESKHG